MKTEKSRSEVFIIGDYFCDLVFSGLPELPRLGHEVYSRDFHLMPGGVYNSAVALHRLGIDIIWPCNFGSDPFSQYVQTQALKEGVDGQYFSDLDHASLHITTAFSFAEERAFLTYSDAYDAIAYSEFIEVTEPQWVAITHLLTGQKLERIVNSAREIGAKIFMDCQAHSHTLDEAVVQEALSIVDIFSPNRAEAQGLTGRVEAKEMLHMLGQYAPTVIIKDGANGSFLKSRNKILHQPAIPVNVVDTTGAGDNFDSGFLFGRLRGFSLTESLRAGNICGALSVQGFGGTSTSPTEEELLALLKK